MNHDDLIRPFKAEDRTEVLRVFNLNCPQFFDPNEVKDLEQYLDAFGDTYYVMEVEQKIIGCGGYHFEMDGTTGRLSWDFFDPNYKGRGLGRAMISHCLEEIRKNPDLKKIAVWTSQLASRFYAKFGFETVKEEKDYWGPSLHLYLMEMEAGR
ncbi:MAG: GNAT family N-acetyltransferase [Cyclobacteriaceae bacterium]